MNEINWNNFEEEQALRKSMYHDLWGEKDELVKSWSKEIEKKYPNGSWKTINGSKVFIDGGRVIAGADNLKEAIGGKGESGGKKEKPVNERSNQEISEAKQKIADTMPKPINKMTWDEFKPFGIEMQKQSSHSQPDSFYERHAKREYDWAIKNDKSQYNVTDKQKDNTKESKEEKKDKSPSKEKLTPRAEGILNRSQEQYDNSSPEKKKEMLSIVKDNLKKDKHGKDTIGMGLDEDMVAAGKEFIKRNDTNLKDKVDYYKGLSEKDREKYRNELMDNAMDMMQRIKNTKEESSKKVYQTQLDFTDALFKEINKIEEEANIPISKQTDKQFLEGDWKYGGKRKDLVDNWTKQALSEVGKNKKFKSKDEAKKEVNKMANNVKGIDDEQYRVLKMVAKNI